MTIQPIETRYKGYRFRSRLEARWAVFFDALSIGWKYEPQGFRIDGRSYLPDFLLTDCGTWIEVKGSEHELDRELMLAAGNQLPLMPYCGDMPGPRLMILGDIPEPVEDGDWGWTTLGAGEYEGHAHGFSNFGREARPWVHFSGETVRTGWLDPVYTGEVPASPHAYRAARSARFEHGESGA